jgi:hypothetical protein
MRNLFEPLMPMFNIKVLNRMYNICLFFYAFIAFNVHVIGQNCLPAGITFTTQTSIDNFAVDYPGCTYITGSVIISGTGITNLNGLSQVTRIGETYPNGLYISNTNLTNLQGLNNLTAIDGGLKIENNPMLINLTGLESITRLYNGTEIKNNPNLVNLQGLNNVTQSNYFIKIISNSSLQSLTGLNNILTIGYDSSNGYCNTTANLQIISNVNLLNINALQNLEQVCGHLYIQSNTLLQDIYLPNLQLIGQSLGIGWNNTITHLNNLSNLTYVGNGITLQYNLNLSSISGLGSITSFDIYSAISIFGNKLNNLNGLEWAQNIYDVTIEDEDYIVNLQGLNNIQQINGTLAITGCNLLQNISALNLLTSVGSLYFDSNPVLTSLNGLQNLGMIGGTFYFKRNHLVPNFQGLNNVTSISGGLVVLENNGLTSFSGLNGVTSLAGRCEIYSNNALNNLTGLGLLSSIGGYLSITYNPNLISIAALSNLVSINGKLELISNGQLSSLNGLQHISQASITNLIIRDNGILSFCEISTICNYLDVVPAKPVTISNNSANCASVSNVNAACDLVLPVQYTAWYAEKTPSLKSFLFWSTASEFNNSGWNILRSKDGKAWEPIGWVFGSGNSTKEKSYTFTDPRPMKGLNYYRLKQIDYDGTTFYSDVKYLKFHTDEVSIYPNPVSDKLYLIGSNDDSIYSIADINGRIITQGTITDEYIDVSGLINGIYVLKVDNGVSLIHHRMMKVE